MFEVPQRLAQSLTDSRSNPIPQQLDRASFIKNVELHTTLPQDHPEFASPILDILHLFSSTQLQSVIFKSDDCSICSPVSFPSLLPTLFPYLISNLKMLSFRGFCQFSEGNNIILKHLPNSIEKLSLYGSAHEKVLPSEPLRDGLSDFERTFSFSRLSTLQLSCIDLIPPATFELGLRTWSHRLRHLILDMCDVLCGYSLIRTLIDHCPKLSCLQLEMSDRDTGPTDQITDTVLCELLDGCLHLEILSLDNIPGVNNKFLAHCAARATSLRHLFLGAVDISLTGKGIVDVSGWAKLEYLYLDCDQLDPAFKQIVDANWALNSTSIEYSLDSA
ncbi:hypothetical protein BC937DRAFT_88192, partial [Endogone sp. FLAS-F59071]